MTGLVIGLTGGIGSGKSAVADCFARQGVPVVDTDALAHELTAPSGGAISALRQAFGNGMLTAEGALDRVAMRRLAFSDVEARKRLEAILHPMILDLAKARCHAHLASGAPYVMVVVPLLLESGADRDWLSRVAVVDCDDETRMQRVMRRSHLDREEVERIMATQVDRQARLAVADDVIQNTGSLDDLAGVVGALDEKYRSISAGTRMTG